MDELKLRKLLRKECNMRRIEVTDILDDYMKGQENDEQYFVDIYTASKSKAIKVCNKLQSLGYETDVYDCCEVAAYDDDHPEWLTILATKPTERA